jgi:ribonuclease HI
MNVMYTDGSTSMNPGPGSFAALLICPGFVTRLYLKKSKGVTTSNRAELAAIITPLKELPQFKETQSLRIVTDSKYVEENYKKRLRKWINADGRKHDGNKVSNFDLWKELYSLSLKHILTIEWCPSHAGVWENEIVDYAARQILKPQPSLELIPPEIEVIYL